MGALAGAVVAGPVGLVAGGGINKPRHHRRVRHVYR